MERDQQFSWMLKKFLPMNTRKNSMSGTGMFNGLSGLLNHLARSLMSIQRWKDIPNLANGSPNSSLEITISTILGQPANGLAEHLNQDSSPKSLLTGYQTGSI
ncbi:hypothetical protein C497_06459 [Halalkalicoccus jeotgali B3]|uniref:Uncharacterized protein n=1 Tax=Halalkalicoccus jeotgali (strain DSM 18796 / CECT 7217 / JCM 14584 / KCTC 4019 / B3) TaxID=795797 RepID=D8JCC7_HALJB|nr:hypothetical protein HacjB3_18458 [Halalkalicoccus jeotgali B3]ELY38803.1 hypothetical protein C497_06459 [Halalkalicoccus jeotgali B3]